MKMLQCWWKKETRKCFYAKESVNDDRDVHFANDVSNKIPARNKSMPSCLNFWICKSQRVPPLTALDTEEQHQHHQQQANATTVQYTVD
jgi:hypothetical protein